MRSGGARHAKPAWAFMEKFVIPNLDNPTETYLTRWRIIETPWFGIFLHRMDGPDSRPTLHDHPWGFLSIVFRGGYDEERLDLFGRDAYSHVVKRFNRMRTHDAHYIRFLLREPTWTLVFVGPRRRRWGYLERREHSHQEGWTPFDEHPYNEEFNAAMEARQ